MITFTFVGYLRNKYLVLRSVGVINHPTFAPNSDPGSGSLFTLASVFVAALRSAMTTHFGRPR